MTRVHNNLAHFSRLSANCFLGIRITPISGLFLIIQNAMGHLAMSITTVKLIRVLHLREIWPYLLHSG